MCASRGATSEAIAQSDDDEVVRHFGCIWRHLSPQLQPFLFKGFTFQLATQSNFASAQRICLLMPLFASILPEVCADGLRSLRGGLSRGLEPGERPLII